MADSPFPQAPTFSAENLAATAAMNQAGTAGTAAYNATQSGGGSSWNYSAPSSGMTAPLSGGSSSVPNAYNPNGTVTSYNPTTGYTYAEKNLNPAYNTNPAFNQGTSVNWTNPNNVFGAGNATNTTNPSGVLRVLGFGFSVPVGATITGVEVTINISGSSGSTDNSIRLVKASVASGTAKTLGGLETSLANKLYGSRFDLWGNTLSVSDVNSATFGVDINLNNLGTITVDSVRINVYYTDDKLYKSSAADASGFLVAGIAKATTTSGQTVQFIPANNQITGSSLVPGRPVYLSDTAGIISQTAGTREIILGKALTTTSWLFEGKKCMATGSQTIVATQLVHRQVNIGFKPRQVFLFAETSGNDSAVSYSSRGGQVITAAAGSPPYASASSTLGWASYTAAGGLSCIGTATLTDDGFLLVPSAASNSGTVYYEAYD